MSGTQQSFASNSWKKNGGINRTATNNIVRTPKAITGKLNIYENIGPDEGTSNTVFNNSIVLNNGSGIRSIPKSDASKNYLNIIDSYSFTDLSYPTPIDISNQSTWPVLSHRDNLDLKKIPQPGSRTPITSHSDPLYGNCLEFKPNSNDISGNIALETTTDLSQVTIYGNSNYSYKYYFCATTWVYPTKNESNDTHIPLFVFDTSDQSIIKSIHYISNKPNPYPLLDASATDTCLYLWFPNKNGDIQILYSPSNRPYSADIPSGEIFIPQQQIYSKTISAQNHIKYNDWNFVALQLDGINITLFVNGKQIINDAISSNNIGNGTYVPITPLSFNHGPYWVDTSSNFANGAIDISYNNNSLYRLLDFNFFNGILPQKIINDLYFLGPLKPIEVIFNLSDTGLFLQTDAVVEKDLYVAGNTTTTGTSNNYSTSNFFQDVNFYGNIIQYSKSTISTDVSTNNTFQIKTSTGNKTSFTILNGSPDYSMLVYNNDNNLTTINTQDLQFSISKTNSNVSIGPVFGTNTFDVCGNSSFYGDIDIKKGDINFTDGYIGISQNDQFGPIRIGYGPASNSQGGSSIAIGNNAGETSQRQNGIAIGAAAGYTGQGDFSIAMGNYAGKTSQGNYAIALGVGAGQTDQSNNSVALGQDAGNTSQGTNAIAIGFIAGQTSQGTNAIALGARCAAGYTGQGNNSVAIGYEAGYNGQDASSVAIGASAGYTGQGVNSVAIGHAAGQKDQSNNSVAIGHQAGYTDQSNNSVAIGHAAGHTSQGQYSVAMGYEAGYTDQSNNSVAIGNGAGNSGQGEFSVAMGFQAGQNDQSIYSIAMGYEAGQTSQGEYSIAMGYAAGYKDQSNNSVAIGYGAGFQYQNANSVAIGNSAGNSGQGVNSVAMGTGAGQTGQGNYSVAIGNNAGYYDQGNETIAIGRNAGYKDQSNNSVAMGNGACEHGQGEGSVAIGQSACNAGQGSDSVAIGYNTVCQNNTSVALGSGATTTADHQIVLGTASETVLIPGVLDVSGTVTAASFNSSSDVRLKENITNLDNSLDKICNIRGVNYNWKNDETKTKTAGVIAQEVLEQIPEAVIDSDSEKLSVNYNSIIAHLIESVKTLKSEINDLKGQLKK